MTITIEMTPELEHQIQQAAEQLGLAPEAFIVETLRDHLSHPQQGNSPVQRLSSKESQLLQKINQSIASIDWIRYRLLIDSRRAETLALEDQQELIGISDQIEQANVQRMKYIIELARLRNMTPLSLIQELGLHPTPDV